MILAVAALLLFAPQTNYARSPAPSPNEAIIDRQKQDQRDKDSGRPAGPPAAVFLKTPTVDDLRAAYPAAAAAANLAGEAVMRCKVDKAGGLADCKVTGETPARSGFGDAALTLSKVFLLDTKATDGSSMVGRNVTIPMKFKPTT